MTSSLVYHFHFFLCCDYKSNVTMKTTIWLVDKLWYQVHHLFPPLAFLMDACLDLFDEDVQREVASPFMTQVVMMTMMMVLSKTKMKVMMKVRRWMIYKRANESVNQQIIICKINLAQTRTEPKENPQSSWILIWGIWPGSQQGYVFDKWAVTCKI